MVETVNIQGLLTLVCEEVSFESLTELSRIHKIVTEILLTHAFQPAFTVVLNPSILNTHVSLQGPVTR